jgi:hypothetical protein
VTEGFLRQAQPVFPEARELGQSEGESGVVAERAEVAEVVGNALTFEQQRAQPAGALGTWQPASDSSAMQ